MKFETIVPSSRSPLVLAVRLILLTILTIAAVSDTLDAQGTNPGLTSPVAIPLYNTEDRLIIYATFGTNTNAYPYVFDTGSFAFATANGTNTAFWGNSNYTPTGTFSISYGTGSLNYQGNVGLSTVTLTYSNSTNILSVTNSTLGIVTNQPRANWNSNIDSTPPIAPEAAGTFGTFGAGLYSTSASNGSMSSILGQIPINTNDLDQGFIVHSGGATATNATLTIGLTHAAISNFPTLVQMRASTGTVTNSTGQSVNLYPEDQLLATITLVNPQGLIYTMSNIPAVVDSGGLGTHFDGGTNFTIPSSFIDADGNLLASDSFSFTVPGANGASELDWSFTAGKSLYTNKVNFTNGGVVGAINTGIAIYHNYDVMFDTTTGLMGFDPLNINLNSTNPSYQGSYLYQGSGAFTNALGTNIGQIQWTGGGGFSAQGGNLTVHIPTANSLLWGQTNFVPSGQSLYFGSPTSDGTVVFQNGLDLGGTNQTFLVTQGISNHVPGANLTGNITNGGLIVGDSNDTGTLILSGTNTYTNGTTINGGILQFAKILSMPASGTVTVNSNATLAINVGGAGEFTTNTSGNGSIGGIFNGLGGQSGSTVNFMTGSAVGIDMTDAGGSLTYAGNITNAGVGLIKLGMGTLILTGNNTYNGGTTVSDGTLQLGVGGSGTATVGNGSGDNGNLLVNGGRLESAAGILGNNSGSSGSAAVSGGIWVNNGALTIGNNGSGTLTISGVGTVTVGSGSGTVTLASGAGSQGTLSIESGYSAGILSAGTLSAATVTGGSGTATVNFNQSNASCAFTPALAGNLSVNQAGSGITILSAANTYNGVTTVSSGTLQFAQILSMSASSAVTVDDGGTLAVNLGGAAEFTSATNGNGSLGGLFNGLGGQSGSTVNLLRGSVVGIDTTDASGPVSYEGSITNDHVGLNILGTGTFILTGNNSYGGVTTISSGTLQIGTNGGSGSLGTGNVTDNSSLIFDRSGVLTVGGNISGSGEITQIGSGSLILTGTNSSYSGATLLDGGSTVVQDSGLLSSGSDIVVGVNNSAVSLVISNGGQVYADYDSNNNGVVVGYGSNSSNNSVVVTESNSTLVDEYDLYAGYNGSSNSLIISNGGSVYADNSTNNNGVVVGYAANSSNNSVVVTGSHATLSSAASVYLGYNGSGNRLVISNGGQVLSGTGYYNEPFVVGYDKNSSNNMVLVTGSNSTLNAEDNLYVGQSGSGNSLVISNGGTVESPSSVISSNTTASNNLVLVTGVGSLFTNSGSLTNGDAGGGTLTVANGGTVAAAGGIIIAASNTAIGTLNIGSLGGSDSAGTIIAPTITFGSGAGSINFNQTDTATIDSTISGAGSLNQLGSGTTTLSLSNSYTGSTIISAGSLVIGSGGSIMGSTNINIGSRGTLDLSSKGAYTLGTKQTLSGSGTITAPTESLTVNGNITPGSIDGTTRGLLTVNGSLALDSTAVTTLTLMSTNGGAGNGYDGLAITGALQYGGQLNLIVNTTPTVGVFDLFGAQSYSTGLTGVALAGSWNPGSFMGDNGIWSYTDHTFDWIFTESTGDLTVSLVPEPSSWALLGMGIGLLVLLFRAGRRSGV